MTKLFKEFPAPWTLSKDREGLLVILDRNGNLVMGQGWVRTAKGRETVEGVWQLYDQMTYDQMVGLGHEDEKGGLCWVELDESDRDNVQWTVKTLAWWAGCNKCEDEVLVTRYKWAAMLAMHKLTGGKFGGPNQSEPTPFIRYQWEPSEG